MMGVPRMLILLATLAVPVVGLTAPVDLRGVVESIIGNHCLECHDQNDPEGDFDLESLPLNWNDPANRARWIEVYDRVERGEMPPKNPANFAEDRVRFLKTLGRSLTQADLADIAGQGRGPSRRMTRSEYEHNLRDFLRLPDLDIKDLLPAERSSHGYTKAAASLDLSRVQLAAFLDAADAALRTAIASGPKPIPPSRYTAKGTDLYPKLTVHAGRESMHFTKQNQMVRITNAELKEIEQRGLQDPELEMALFRSATWPYYGYPRRFRAKHTGAYKLRVAARAVRQLPGFRLKPAMRPVPLTFRARQPSAADVSGDVRATGGILDILPTGGVYDTTIHLKAGEVFEYSLLGLPVPHPITSHGGPLYYNFPPMPTTGHRGIAFKSLEVTGPLSPPDWPPASHRVLFGDLEITTPREDGRLPFRLVAPDPSSVAPRLIQSFLDRAARAPLPESDRAPFADLVAANLTANRPLAESLLAGYQAFLCSNGFLQIAEPVPSTPHYHYAIASRLSHLLWNSRPDQRLLDLAAAGRLDQSEVLRAETERLMTDARFLRFIQLFAAEWLELRDLRRDSPDVRLYPEYRKEDYLVDSLEQETRAFLLALFRENRSVSNLVDSDFLMVNDRLSRHYELPPVSGSKMRPVPVPKGSPYGGLLTQGAILKLTANGTTTSPITRGVWVAEHLLGEPPPPPPISVPAIQPDLRGRSTVREILAAHTADETCASCHARFDPYGFALENFDIMGAWRDYYRSLENGDEVTGIDRAGHRYAYRIGLRVDASGRLLTGETFSEIEGLRQILAKRKRALAKNLLHQLTLYATGTPVRFSERSVVDSILDQCRPEGYRLRDLLTALIQSRIFIGLDGSQPTQTNP